MYFDKFPKVLYDYNINGKLEYKVVTDITRNVRVINNILNNITLYDEYIMQDGETPEIVADKFYGSPQYHWVVMLTNNRYDYIDDFVLPIYEFEKFVEAKYGVTSISFDSSNNFVVDIINNTFSYNDHPFNTGDQVEYDQVISANTAIGGLVNGKSYFVIKTTNNQFKLATTLTNAQNNNSLNITSLGVGNHKFNLNNQFNIHHYEDADGNVVNATYIDFNNVTQIGSPVTNYQYEEKLNEEKRKIKIISGDLLQTLLKNFDDII